MKIENKRFQDLTKSALYAILRLRVEVFVVEQDCPYQELDDWDQLAQHFLMKDKEGQIIATLRVFPPGARFASASIGRVVVKQTNRNEGLGKALMLEALNWLRDNYSNCSVQISAQTYLKKFYENFGFKQVGEGYLEDGIPHIGMILENID
ncbi:MAG: GNAT family N-acetyltransferase [Crocinitomicaceae bacterium]|nr:GNAT family N-acetyltransferase [Crocinitomicaceae bacterium]